MGRCNNENLALFDRWLLIEVMAELSKGSPVPAAAKTRLGEYLRLWLRDYVEESLGEDWRRLQDYRQQPPDPEARRGAPRRADRLPHPGVSGESFDRGPR